MSDAVEGGASIAWRLLATLEGGSLLLAATALLTYTARKRALKAHRPITPCTNVAITNSSNELGRELKRRLEAHGCVVSTITNDASSRTNCDSYDALVVIGAQPKTEGLDGISSLVTEDVYDNIKLLENLSARVNRGGYIAWACSSTGNTLGAFGNTANAFDAVLHATLVHIAKIFHCVPVWVGRCEGAERTADQVVTALITRDTEHESPRYSIRNAAHTVGEYLYKWLKPT